MHAHHDPEHQHDPGHAHRHGPARPGERPVARREALRAGAGVLAASLLLFAWAPPMEHVSDAQYGAPPRPSR